MFCSIEASIWKLFSFPSCIIAQDTFNVCELPAHHRETLLSDDSHHIWVSHPAIHLLFWAFFRSKPAINQHPGSLTTCPIHHQRTDQRIHSRPQLEDPHPALGQRVHYSPVRFCGRHCLAWSQRSVLFASRYATRLATCTSLLAACMNPNGAALTSSQTLDEFGEIFGENSSKILVA